MKGTQPGGVDERELRKVEHDEGAGRSYEALGESPTSASVKLSREDEDTASVEVVGSNTK
jgi:hypothetical protein